MSRAKLNLFLRNYLPLHWMISSTSDHLKICRVVPDWLMKKLKREQLAIQILGISCLAMSRNRTFVFLVLPLCQYLASFRTTPSAIALRGHTIVTTYPIEAAEESVSDGKL
jgi:hypothetical protein